MTQAHSAQSDTLEGWVDSCDEGVIRGWAWNPAEPGRSVTVEVLIDGQVVATAAAQLARPDVAAAGKPRGDCGFSVQLPRVEADVARIARVGVRVQNGPSLPPGEFEVRLAPRLTKMPIGFGGNPKFSGSFDQFGPDYISGWITNTADPSSRPEIEFWEGGQKLHSFVADLWRTDLEEARQGDGRWGFLTPVPGCLRDGKTRSIEVRLKGENRPIVPGGMRVEFPDLPPIPETPPYRSGDEDRSTRVRPPRTNVPVDMMFSVIVNFYNMPREAERTLTSLTRGYQQGIGALRYEVLCIDNGSSPPLERDWVESFGPEFRLIRPGKPLPSPCAAINAAARQATGRYLAVMIDGAHILTPGVFREVWDAVDGAPDAVVGLRQWFIGGDQRWLSVAGYSRAQEDILFDKIAWPQNGYKLFRISSPVWESPNHWLDGMIESNCLFVPHNLYERIGGMDEAFDEPGAGYANLDLLKRAAAASPEPMIAILGEATFHQFHDGTTTNVSDREKENRVRAYENAYMRLRGETFAGVPPVDIRQHGQLRAQTAVVGRQRPLSPAKIGVTDQVRQGSLPLHFDATSADYLQSVYVECGLHKLTKWLGHEVSLAPADIVEIQDIIHTSRPGRIVAVNVNDGILQLLDSLLKISGLTESRIVRVVADAPSCGDLPASVDLIIGDPCGAGTVAQVKRAFGLEENVLVLFSPRSLDFMPIEALRTYADLVSSRSYLIFLGTVFGQPWLGYSKYWHLSAIKTVAAEIGFVIDHSRNQQLLTTCPSGYLQRISDNGLLDSAETIG